MDLRRHPFPHAESFQVVVDHEKVVVGEVLSEYREITYECKQFSQGILRICCVLISRRILMVI